MTAPEVFRNGLPRMMGALSSVSVSITTKSEHNVDVGAKVAECFWEVLHADGDRDDGASWIASLSS